MIALPFILSVFGPAPAVEAPHRRQPAVSPVPGCQPGDRIVAATHHDAGPNTVEIADAHQEPVDPVAVGITPVGHSTAGNVAVPGQLFPRPAVEYRQEFRPFEDKAVGVDMVRFAVAVDITDRCGGAVDRSFRRPDGNLGLSVAVQVVDDEGSIVSAFADVFPQVDPPEQRAVSLVSFQFRRAGATAALRVIITAQFLLDDDFILSVTIEVPDRCVVDGISRGGLQRDAQVVLHRRAG